jgi:hypothetical protein
MNATTGLAPNVFVLGGNIYPLKWSLRAQYRLQCLPQPSAFADLANPQRATAAAINFAWAMLPPAAAYANPEALALAVEEDAAGMDRLDAALTGALQIAFPVGPEAEAKKA